MWWYLRFENGIVGLSDSHGEEEEQDAEDEDDEGDEAEEAGEDNDRRYNLRQRKAVQRYEAPPIGNWCSFFFLIKDTFNLALLGNVFI